VQRSLVNDPKVRGLFYQTLLVVILVALIAFGWRNAVVNMTARGIPLGFEFWNETAGFDINLSLINYSALSTYGDAFWVGLINTLLVAAISIVLATPLGFLVGIARLSPNWIMSRVALIYVEIMRNTPLLLQLLFWYNAVLKALPGPRQSLAISNLVFLNNRGLYLPKPVFSAGAWEVGAALLVGIMAAYLFSRWAARRQAQTGQRAPVFSIGAALIVLPPLALYFIAGMPIGLNYAALSGFNLRGGLQVFPEFAALVFGLVTYTAAFIAEIVRAGVLAVSQGQTEASSALGLKRGWTMRLIVVPQAMRLIIPPLTSQYLNIVKNSSLAVFIGYPDLVLIFAGTVLNQTHAAVQVMAITMAVYLVISLAIAALLNVYNDRMSLKER
jgi:general L-amino acid transport system permease protein